MRPGIFVSYSHRDSDLVGPVVALLRASEALVFRDADQLKPGAKWRQQLDTAISDSKIFVVFWCSHSRSSEEVRKEYTAAIEQHKDVLPLLIDDTPLPSELAEYQYIDFRAAFPHGHAADQPSPSPPQPSRQNRLAWGLPWIGIALVIVAVSSVWTLKAPSQSNGPGVSSESGASGSAIWLLALLALFVVVMVVRKFKRSRDRQYDEVPATHGVPITQQQVELATTIENELLKRIGKTNEA